MDALSTQISSRSFEIEKRGYEKTAVDSYLRKIGGQVEKLEDALRVARRRIEELEHRSKDASAADTVVRTAFLAAAESKAKLIEDAEAKAEAIVAEAERQAAKLREGAGAAEAESLLVEARRRLEDSEKLAEARRHQAEQEAAEIIAAARARVSEMPEPATETNASDAADELSRLVATLGSLKEAARQGLAQAASLEADIESVIAER